LVFLDGLRRGFDQILGFLEAKAGDGAHFFDDVDLLVAGSSQNNGELRLFRSRCGTSGGTANSSGHRDGCRGGNAPFIFEQLGELGRLEDGQARQVINQFCEISHR